jgi:hypothetical protein
MTLWNCESESALGLALAGGKYAAGSPASELMPKKPDVVAMEPVAAVMGIAGAAAV